MWPPTPFRLIPCVYGCGLFRKGSYGVVRLSLKKISTARIRYYYDDYYCAYLFFWGDKTSRFWLNFRFRFVVFRVGGQTTCKNFSGGGGGFQRTQDVNASFFFVCFSFLVKEKLFKMTSSITRHLFWSCIHSCCCGTKGGWRCVPPRFSFPPNNLVYFLAFFV